MKQTTSVNIGGIVLHIDDDAFQLLSDYIKRLEKHFQKYPEKNDILGDIEQRIGELLTEEITSKEQAISIEHVEKIIGIMGNPQDFEEEKDETADTAPSPPDEDKKHRMLYRNPDNKTIAGVCSGLGIYFKADPTLIRILFLILTLVGVGFPIPLYIILWILIPEAHTLTQKMEMKGESINIDSIKKNVQTGIDDIKSSVKDFTHSGYTHNAISQIGSFIGKVAPVIFNIIFGLSLSAIVIAIIFLFTMKLSAQVICWDLPPTLDPEVLYFISNVDITLLGIGVLFVSLAAITSLFYILPNAIWGEKNSTRLSVQISTVLTTIGIIIIIIALTRSMIDYQAVKEFIFLGGES